MPTSYKVLGQVSPAAATDTTLYTCPASTQTVISTIVVSNNSSSTATFRISVRPDGETLATKHYLCYDSLLEVNDSFFLTTGITLNQSDVITVRSSTSDISFNAFGSEIS